ncbi:MAG: ABC transporter substrate-binding protein [Rhodospirillales bacterium]
MISYTRAAAVFAVGIVIGAAGGFFTAYKPAPDKITLQLKWVTQAQFAGYYVAKDKGYYKDLNLDVTIHPGGPGIVPSQAVRGGAADAVVEWMSTALAEREKGLPLVNIAQPFKRAGMMLVCRKDSGVKTPADFPGRTLGVWFNGNEKPFLNWMAQLRLTPLLNIPGDGSPGRINVLQQRYEIEPILNGEADCISAMNYNEFGRIVDAGLTPDELIIFNYEDEGAALLEDGVYVHEKNLGDPAFVDKMARFVKASMQGWAHARQNPREAALIVLNNDATGARTERHQLRMAVRIGELTDGSDGRLDPEAYERTVRVLLSAGADMPVITKKPSGAWTHKVIDKAQNM